MSNKSPNKRLSRKSVLNQFESRIDLRRLDYAARIRPGRGRAMVISVVTATVIYMLGFGLAYYSWNLHYIPDDFFNKIVWVFMVPASAVGAVTWLIASNRHEFPIREDIRAHVIDFEGEQGLLWRFAPLLRDVELKRINLEALLTASREGRLVREAPEDICAVTQALHARLTATTPPPPPALIAEIESNFNPLEKSTDSTA